MPVDIREIISYLCALRTLPVSRFRWYNHQILYGPAEDVEHLLRQAQEESARLAAQGASTTPTDSEQFVGFVDDATRLADLAALDDNGGLLISEEEVLEALPADDDEDEAVITEAISDGTVELAIDAEIAAHNAALQAKHGNKPASPFTLADDETVPR